MAPIKKNNTTRRTSKGKSQSAIKSRRNKCNKLRNNGSSNGFEDDTTNATTIPVSENHLAIIAQEAQKEANALKKEVTTQLLECQLVECGWYDEIKDIAKEIIATQGGITKSTVDQLVADLLLRGKATVPSSVKKSFKETIKGVIKRNVDVG